MEGATTGDVSQARSATAVPALQAQGVPTSPGPQTDQRNAPAMGGGFGGSAIALLPFIRDRVANVQQQLDGILPTKGDGSGVGVQEGMGMRALQGAGGRGMPGAPVGAPPANRMQPGGLPGAQSAVTSILGVESDQLVPVALSLAILLGATGMVWKVQSRT